MPVKPPDSDLEGSWTVTLGEPTQDPWVGFMVFYPDGTRFMSCGDWSIRNWEFSIDGNHVVGTIAEHGVWSVVMDAKGEIGRGNVGSWPFLMARVSASLYRSPIEHATGQWDMWTAQDTDTSMALSITELAEADGCGKIWAAASMAYINMGLDQAIEVELEGAGHVLRTKGSTRIGKVEIQFTRDGTALCAKVGPTKYQGWRRREES
uniref:Uncharacterized protein n=1 Tax=Zooxanthella nutricula TaxID=1333877 RepID=A0A7S2M4H5_9DINO